MSIEGAFHVFWACGCGTTSPPIEKIVPTGVLEAAFDDAQGVGSRLRPVTSCPFESAADDLLASAFHDARSDQQSALPAKVAAHQVFVGLAVANAGRECFKPAVWHQVSNDVIDLSCVQLILDRLHPIPLFAFVRRHGFHSGVHILDGKELFEDEAQFPLDKNLLA